MTRFQSPRAGVVLTVVALALMCGVAVVPLLTGTMPESADGAIHLYRLPILDHAFKDGSLWPRYPVATVYGYGSPLFNFYSPLSLMPMHALHLVGFSYLNAWLLGMALYVLTAAGGAYLLGRTWGGETIGVVAAAAYVYSPYFIYDYLWRGTTSETAALALLPWVLWSVKTQADHPSRRTFIAVIFSLAMFIPMHNITTVHGGVLIGLYSLVVALTARNWKLATLRVFGALAVGALLATFYWYPAIRETPNIKIDAITAALPDIDVTRNLVSAWSAFQLPYSADPSLQQPPFAVALGWPQVLLGFVALLSMRMQPARVKVLLIMSAVGVAFLVFMLTPASAPIWRSVPFIGYSQYPTRLLGPASLLLALLAGYGVHRLTRRAIRLNGKLVAVGVPIALIVLYTLPLGVRTPQPQHNPQSVVSALDFEREYGFVGSSSFGEYVPVWTAELPNPMSLRQQYAEHTYVPRLEQVDGVTIEAADWRHTSGVVTVTSADETTLTFNWLYMPYFQATIDGEAAPVEPSEGSGLVQVNVPAGTHTVSVWLAPSRTQAISAFVSLTALAATTGLLALWPLLRGRPAVAYVHRFEVVREARRALIAAALAGVVALGAKAVFDHVPNPLRQDRLAAGFDAIAENVVDANLRNEITLIGYDGPESSVPAGSTADFRLYWTPRAAEITRDYVTVFTVRTPGGLDVYRTNDDRPGGIETHHWRHGQYVRQVAYVEVPAGTPPGRYSIAVQMYDSEAERALDIINTQNNPIGIEILLGTIDVVRGQRLSDIPNAEGQAGAELDGMRLFELSGMPDAAGAGDVLTVQGKWELAARQPDVNLRLEWREPDGGTVVGSAPLDLNAPLPLSEWQVGDLWRIPHHIVVPREAAGTLQLAVAASDEASISVGTMHVTAPERSFELPADLTEMDAAWGNGVRLAGYIEGDGAIILYWATDAGITADLRRFAHVVDDGGGLVLVADGVPAEWTRPVTSWLPSEFVADPVPLAVQSGQRLRIGFYDADTYERVPTADGAEFVDIIKR